MIWIVHTDSRVQDFVADLLEDQEGSKTFVDNLTMNNLKRIKDGDSVYGTLQISQMLMATSDFSYFNIVPPKPDKSNWKAWHYEVRHFDEDTASNDIPEAKAAIFEVGNEEYERDSGKD